MQDMVVPGLTDKLPAALVLHWWQGFLFLLPCCVPPPQTVCSQVSQNMPS